MENQSLVNFLNRQLSNYFVLYVKLHRYHWYIQGRHFFQLHEKFEELYNMCAEEADVIAERILMINGRPLATMSKYIEEASIEEATADNTEEEMIAQLTADFKQIIEEIKSDGYKLCEENRDEPTLDMLVSIQSKLDKHVWMLMAYQEEK